MIKSFIAIVFRFWTRQILVVFFKYKYVVIIRIPACPSHFQLMHTQGQIMICWPSLWRLALLLVQRLGGGGGICLLLVHIHCYTCVGGWLSACSSSWRWDGPQDPSWYLCTPAANKNFLSKFPICFIYIIKESSMFFTITSYLGG